MESVDSRPPGGPLPPPQAPDTGPPVVAANPEFQPSPSPHTPGHHQGEVDLPGRLPMAIFRALAAVAFAGAFGLSGVQIYRVVDEQERSGALSWGSLLIGLTCVAAVMAWTYAVVENAKRILAPAVTQELPDPRRAVALWLVPLAFIVPAATVVVVMSQRWNTPAEGTSSSSPLLVAFGAILVSLLLLYAPLSYVAGVVRRVGGQSISLLKWAWVPVVLGIVGAAGIAGLRAFGTFEEETDGLAPTWVIAVLLLVPVVIVFVVALGAGRDVEDTVSRAFDRRIGRAPSVGGRGTQLPSVFGGERPNRAVLSTRGPIKLLPAANVLRLAMVTVLAGLALLSVVGAIVMFLFWRESNNGLLLPSQRDRAWQVLDQLQVAERFLAVGLLLIVMVWSFVSVYNARMASGRRRNPVLAAAAWPLTAAGIWAIGARVAESSESEVVVAGFLAQAALLYVPFFFLERAATAVGGRRSPIRIVYAMGVLMHVYMQGLGGLSTIEQVADTDQFGRLAGYLALGALVQLLSTLAVTEASRTISDACEHEVEHHNFLIGQRSSADARTVAPVVVAD